MPDGPTAYAKLMDVRLNEPRGQLRKHFDKRGQDDAEAVADLLNQAYLEGLRDGFAQGVAHAEERRDD